MTTTAALCGSGVGLIEEKKNLLNFNNVILVAVFVVEALQELQNYNNFEQFNSN